MPKLRKQTEQATVRKIALRAVLHRRMGVQAEPHPSGVTLVLPKRRIIPGRRRRFHRVELDRVGQLVWEAADGKTVVAQIIHRVAQKIERPFNVAEETLFAFLKHMTGRGLLLLMAPTRRPKRTGTKKKSNKDPDDRSQ